MPFAEQLGTFTKVFEFEYEKVPVVLYRCQETGLRLALARVQSPTVHGYFTVQTEAFDDYGCPHTLEHLIFLGSERYPYKGALDVLANRCLAQGTNAWTDTDHTCYTVETAGSEGFLRILPVYLDHVLFPTLKDSAFVTEVHHVTGEGANAGVVYCEMQARENEAGDMLDREMKLAAYPGKCSYKAETGGRLKELRELTNTMVRDYHKAYYRPDNLCVCVTGQVDVEAFCEAVKPVVESIRSSERIKALPPLERPFSAPVPKPSEPVVTRIEFPAEDESTSGRVYMAWHGPSWQDLETTTALPVLLSYLTQDSIAPMRKALVETQPALCGKLDFSVLEQSVYLFYISLKSVNMEELGKRDVNKEVTDLLKAQADAAGAAIDIERMRSLIRQQHRQHLSSVEESPHDLFIGHIIGAFMYAPDFAPGAKPSDAEPGAALRERLDLPKLLEKLLEWPASRWAALLDAWMLGPSSSPRVTVIGTPSKAYGERIQAEDTKRIAEQKAALGEAGCKAAAEALAKAEEENDVETPEEVAQKFQLPDVSKITLIEVATVTLDAGTGALAEISGAEAKDLKAQVESCKGDAYPPLAMRFDHVAGAQFVQCHVLLQIDGLKPDQMELLPLWRDVALELPLSASDNGPAMDHEEVVKALTDITVSSGCSVGVGGGRFSVGAAANTFHIAIKVERARYAEAPLWLARLLADSVFDIERLRSAATRILNDVPNAKQDGKGLARLALRALSYKDECPDGAFNVFRVERVLRAILDEEGGLAKAAARLADLRAALLAAPALVRIAGDVRSLGDGVLSPWRRAPFTGAARAAAAAPTPALARELFAADAVKGRKGPAVGCLLSSSAEESNYWTVVAPSLTDPQSPELAPLLVAIEYCVALEGPFWRKIRGKGLAYSYSLSHSLETGSIRFGLFKASDPVAAFQQSAQILRDLCADAPPPAAGEEGEGKGKAGEAKGKAEKEAPEKKGHGEGKKEEGGDEEEGEEDEEGGDEDDDEEEYGLNATSLEAAQSGVLFQLIEPVDTVPNAMDEVFSSALARLPADQLQRLLREVQAVSEASVKAALRKHVLPLFTGSAGRVVSMICPARKRKDIQAGLRKLRPPFRAVHLEVDELVKTLAPADGYAGLRRLVVKGRPETADKGRGKGGAQERRVDPADGGSYTFSELAAFYKGKYTPAAIKSYWEATCRPAKAAGATAKAAGKAKAKAKADAKPKAAPKPKAEARGVKRWRVKAPEAAAQAPAAAA